MKNRPSIFKKALVAMIAIACLAALRVSNAQTPPPSAPPVNPNASEQVSPPNSPPPGSMSITPSPTPTPSNGQTPTLPYGATEVLKMYQGGIGKDVILNYINNTTLMYHMTADGIIYLQSVGVPQEIVKAMILRDGQLQQQQWALVAPPNGQQPASPQGSVPPPGSMPPPGAYPYAGQPYGTQAPVQVESPSTPPPDVTVIGAPDYPVYDASYYGWPYYGYYGPVVVGGFGWGWGHGYGHGWGGYHGGYGGGFRGGGAVHGGGGGGFHGGGSGHR